MRPLFTWLPAKKYQFLATMSLGLLLILQACGGSSGNYKNYGGKNGGSGVNVNGDAKFTGQIIFVKQHNIWILHGKDNSATQLTSDGLDLQPSLSRDGKTLAFQVRHSNLDYSNLATMPLAGGSPTLITDNSMHVISPGVPPQNHYQFWANEPIWTADGQNIIYLTDFFKGGATTPISNPTCYNLSNGDWILDMGIAEMPATAQATPALQNPPRLLSWPYCYAGGDQDISLRPGVSDTEILFTSFQYTGQNLDLTAQISLLIIPNDGSPSQVIQLSPPDPNAVPMEPSWSPDGKYITYIRRESSQDNLYIMPIPDTTVTGTPNNESYPLVNNGRERGKSVYSTNTSYYQQSQQLAQGIYGNPIWSPDGKNLVFMKFDTTDNGGVFNLFMAKLKFSAPAASPSPTGTPNPTATTTPASGQTISIDGAQVPLTQGGVDGDSRPIWIGA